MKTAVKKNERIFESLRDGIISGTLSPGELIPSQATLMREHGVALGTVRQALNRLQAEGLISSKHGKGCFVRQRQSHWMAGLASGAIGLVAFDGTDVAEYDYLMSMRESLAKANLQLTVGVYAPDQVESAIDWARQLSGVIARNRPPRAFLEALAENKIPAVMMGNMHEGPIPREISHIRFQIPSAMDQAVQYLANLGHTNIWFVNRRIDSAARYPEFLRELSTLFNTLATQRIENAIIDEVMIQPGEEQQLISRLNAAETPPTALLIEGGQRACTVMHEMERAGWSTPERISVLAISPLQASTFSIPALSYVELPMHEMAVRGTEIMIESLNNNWILRETVCPRLHWGNTCRHLHR